MNSWTIQLSVNKTLFGYCFLRKKIFWNTSSPEEQTLNDRDNAIGQRYLAIRRRHFLLHRFRSILLLHILFQLYVVSSGSILQPSWEKIVQITLLRNENTIQVQWIQSVDARKKDINNSPHRPYWWTYLKSRTSIPCDVFYFLSSFHFTSLLSERNLVWCMQGKTKKYQICTFFYDF